MKTEFCHTHTYAHMHTHTPYTHTHTHTHTLCSVESCGNLVEYVERMKMEFWPDWDDHHTHGFTKPENFHK